MKGCKEQETCQRFFNGTKRKGHHIRISDKCKYWNGSYCTDEVAGVQEGDACNIEKIRKIKRGLKNEH